MTVKVGIIGAGVMGTDHARLLTSAVAGAELVSVYDADPARAKAAAGLAANARVADSPAALIGDPAVDAVLVASPDSTHAALAIACLDAGKPVLCEKPLAPTAAECLEVLKRETALGRRLVTVGYMRRFDPGYVEMKRRLDSGELGAALIMHCVHRNKVAAYAAMPSAHIANTGVHEIDIARFIFGCEIVRARVILPRSTSLAPMRDPQILILEMADGAVVDVEIYLNAHYGYDVRAELVCEKGSVSLFEPRVAAVNLPAGGSVAYPDDWRPRFVAAYQAEQQAWIRSIASGMSAGASAWDGYVATAVAETGVRALNSGKPEDVVLIEKPALYR